MSTLNPQSNSLHCPVYNSTVHLSQNPCAYKCTYSLTHTSWTAPLNGSRVYKKIEKLARLAPFTPSDSQNGGAIRSCLRQLQIYGAPWSFWPCLPGWRLLRLVAPTTLSTWITAIGTIEAPLDFAYLDDKALTRLAPSSAFYLDNGYWHIGGTNLLGNSSSLSVLGTQKNLVIYFI